MRRVRDLSVPDFGRLLDQVTAEFQQFLSMVNMGDDEAFESMLDQVIEAFTFKAGQILQADKTSLFLIDEDRGELWSKVAQGDAGVPIEIRVPLRAGVVGHVVSTGRSLNVPSAYDEPLFNREVDQRTGYRTRNILCLPVVDAQGRVLGALSALNKAGGGAFDASDEQRFREVASSMTVILETWQRLRRPTLTMPRTISGASPPPPPASAASIQLASLSMLLASPTPPAAHSPWRSRAIRSAKLSVVDMAAFLVPRAVAGGRQDQVDFRE